MKTNVIKKRSQDTVNKVEITFELFVTGNIHIFFIRTSCSSSNVWEIGSTDISSAFLIDDWLQYSIRAQYGVSSVISCSCGALGNHSSFVSIFVYL